MVRTRRTGRTEHETAEVAPEACPNGHPWRRARSYRTGFLPCICSPEASGHRIWTCVTCEAVISDPPHDWSRPATKGSLYDS